MFNVRPASAGDLDAAIAVLGDAFAQDPLMHYFFGDDAKGVRARVMEFFSILFRARVALGAPAYVLEVDSVVRGAAMGYDSARPTWSDGLTAEMHAFEKSVVHLSARFAGYETICDSYQPPEDHFYLGVLGVDPRLQGRGGGKALLDAFCAPSRADPHSGGVYLDTTNARSLDFYYKNGFALRGEASVDGVTVWCVYKKT